MNFSLPMKNEKNPGRSFFRRGYNTGIVAGVLLTFLLSLPTVLHAQTVGLNGNGTDYRIRVTYTDLGDRCNCGSSVSMKGYDTGFESGTNLFHQTGLAESGTHSFDLGVGPSYSKTYYITIYWDGKQRNDGCVDCYSTPLGECSGKACNKEANAANSIQASTVGIKAPTSVTASNGTHDNKIVISWQKGSDIPNQYLDYKIYRGSTLIATVDGSTFSYEDTDMTIGQSYTYYVTSFTDDFRSTSYESSRFASGASAIGTTFTVGTQVSQGEFYNRAKISWNNVSEKGTEDIKIERSLPSNASQFEEIAIVNRNATSYNDYDAIPGFTYSYRVTPLAAGKTFLSSTNTGYRRPNGVLKGEIKSKGGAGVPNVIITAIDTFMVENTQVIRSYRDTTDASGYYEIRDIYYYKEAEYTIKATKTNHGFKPSSLKRTLNLNSPTLSGNNITDTTVYTLAGKVYLPGSGNTNCALSDVQIYLNGRFTGVKTKADGTYAIPIEEEGNYTISARYYHHTFAAVNSTTTNASSYSFYVDNSRSNLDFRDSQQDNLAINFKGACDNIIADSASFLITAINNTGCYSRTVNTNASGFLQLALPAQAYLVELKAVHQTDSRGNKVTDTNILKYFRPMEIDLTVRDTLTTIKKDSTMQVTPADTVIFANGTRVITPADTNYVVRTDTLKTAKAPRLDFIYRSAISVNILDLPAKICLKDGNQTKQVYRMEQGDEYPIQIEVNNIFTYKGQTSVCRVDTGTVTIYDDISGVGAVTLPIRNGYVYYTIKAGNPKIVYPYTKLLQVQAKVGFLQPHVTQPIYVFVTGNAPRTKSFVTRTPELPLMVLHDPPGGNSFSYLEQGSKLTYNYKSSVQIGGGAGFFVDLYAGGKGFGIEAKAGVKVEFEAGGGRTDGTDVITTISTSKRFATSDDPNFTGEYGDVFVSAGINMQYSLTDVVGYNAGTCTVVRDTALIWLPQDATTYLYTERHVRQVLIPNLEKLIKLETKDSTKTVLQSSIDIWKQALAKNKAKIASVATMSRDKVENISFSAGAPYSSSKTIETDSVDAYEYTMYVDASLAPYLKVDVNGSGLEAGVFGKFRWEKTVTQDTSRVTSKTTGYEFSDTDIGDFFSVDIAEDAVSGTPLFMLAAGTSSCPHEIGTQPRDSVLFEMNTYSISNVPSEGKANFIAKLTNLSQSEEIREYEVRVLPTSNLDGAIIKLGGQIINNSPAAFFIPPGETMNTLLTVEKGPITSVYENLKLIMYAGCEYELWGKNGDITTVDTVSIDVYFQTQCSNVALYAPGNNWLVNKNSNNILNVAFTGYDVNNKYLESIRLQYRKTGGSWETVAIIPKSALTQQYYDYAFNVSSISEDGEYELRAEAICSIGQGTTYSSIQKGIIDRNSIAPFGMPTPSDGFLRMGQEISVKFDKPINCNLQSYSQQITLVRADNGAAIPFTLQCASNLNKLIIAPTTPLSTRRDLDGVELIASVNGIKDNSGNVQQYPISWSFKVNSKPVIWEPSPLNASVVIGSGVPIVATLKNVTDIAKAFTLTSIPSWLVTNVTTGAILANNDFSINFTVKPDLNPGIYTGKIIASVDGVAEELPVTLELLAIPVAWRVNPSDYDYTMSIVAQFSMDNGNTNLSTDTRDIIGVFVNGVARGVAKIQKVDNQNRFVAYITVYSNESLANKETLSFRMWKALSGVEYGAIERTPFVVDGTLGSVNSPYILHPEGIFQVIPLNKGWNSISLNVSTSDMSRDKVFNSILASGNRITVKNQTQFAEFSPISGWSGALTTLNTSSSYMVFLSDKPDTLRVVGNPAVISPISLTGAWNWIGYPRQTKADLSLALSTFAARNNDLLKSTTAFATYTVSGNSGFWLGDLKQMEPGRGYRIKLSAPATLTYPNGRRAIDGSGFEVDEQKYEYNMTVTAMLQVNEADALDDHFTVAAYVNGSCRGFARPEYVAQLKAYRLYLTIHGDQEDAGAPIQFKVFNAISGNEIVAASTKNINFGIDMFAGNADAPFVISWNESGFANGYFLSQNRPNPFTGSTVFDFSIPKQESVKVTVYNQFGARVKVLVNEIKNAGNHRVTFESNSLPAGVYIYELKTDDYSTRRKMVIIR
jgi:hypothetical protein